MNLTEKIYHVIKPLPENIVQEVLGFALFLRQREEKAEWQNLINAQSTALNYCNEDLACNISTVVCMISQHKNIIELLTR